MGLGKEGKDREARLLGRGCPGSGHDPLAEVGSFLGAPLWARGKSWNEPGEMDRREASGRGSKCEAACKWLYAMESLESGGPTRRPSALSQATGAQGRTWDRKSHYCQGVFWKQQRTWGMEEEAGDRPSSRETPVTDRVTKEGHCWASPRSGM